jgi:hypothetical protein
MFPKILAYLLMAMSLWFLQCLEGRTEKYAALADHGVSIDALVLRPDCGNHSTFVYRFEVGARAIEGRDNTEFDCGLVKTGQIVRVYYLPNDPSINMVGDPRKYLLGAKKFAFFLSLILPGLILLAYSRRKR